MVSLAEALKFDDSGQLVLEREALKRTPIDIGGRDIIIGFNEPALKFSKPSLEEGDLDAKLNARLPAYFLPAVEVARMQAKRPRFWIVSGLNMAFKWNAKTERQKKIMAIDNRLKFDFLRTFFERFFPADFSVIEYTVAQDVLRVPEEKLLFLWALIEERHKEDIARLKLILARFKKPHDFEHDDLVDAFKYAISHIFVFGDVNFEGNYILNPNGFLSIGGHQERIFNQIREYTIEMIRERGESILGQKIIFQDNLKLVLENAISTPPPYGGSFSGSGERRDYDEVIFENGRSLEFYDSHEKLQYEMRYMYEQLVPRQKYHDFWESYRERYFDLKARYREAYELAEDF